jgi:predicted amidohydrolase YtcJ
MHVTSPTAIRMAAAAVEAALRRRPGPHRHRLEHGGDFVDSGEDMRRLRDLGIRLVTTPQFIYSQGGIPGTRCPRPMRLRTPVDQGFELIGGSDSTGTVSDGMAPLFNIACDPWGARLSRRGADHGRGGPPDVLDLGGPGRIRGGRQGVHRAREARRLAVLSRTPLTVSADELAEVRADATILGGRVVYER